MRRGHDLLGPGREQWRHSRLSLLGALALFLAGRETECAGEALRSLRAHHELGSNAGMAFALEILGGLAARAGQPERAAWLLGAAGQFWGRADGRPPAGGIRERLQAEAVARSSDALGGKRFATIFAGAGRPGTDRVIAFAAGEDDGGDVEGADDDDGTRIRLPVQLTAREHEIALLVARGHSNRQIAEQLFISRRTVDAHVEHIFAKLGITSRVTLAIRLRRPPETARLAAT